MLSLSKVRRTGKGHRALGPSLQLDSLTLKPTHGPWLFSSLSPGKDTLINVLGANPLAQCKKNTLGNSSKGFLDVARFVGDPYLENVFLFCDLSLYWQTTPCYRNRLRLILPWLEARVAEGNQEPPRCLSLCVFLKAESGKKVSVCISL